MSSSSLGDPANPATSAQSSSVATRESNTSSLVNPVPVRDVLTSCGASRIPAHATSHAAGSCASGQDSPSLRRLFIETEAIEGIVLERLAERFFGASVQVTPTLWVDPLLVDLSRLSDLAQRYRCGLSLTTQGLALTRACFDGLRDGLSHIEVLIHSPRRDVWGYCGRAREFARVTQNVRNVADRARDDGIRVGLSIFPAEWTRAGVDEAVTFAASLGAGSVTLLPRHQARCRMAPAEAAAMQRAESELMAWAAERTASLGIVLLGRDGMRPRAWRDRPWPFRADRATPLLEEGRASGLERAARRIRVTRLGRLEVPDTGEKLGHLVLIPAGSAASRPRSVELSGA